MFYFTRHIQFLNANALFQSFSPHQIIYILIYFQQVTRIFIGRHFGFHLLKSLPNALHIIEHMQQSQLDTTR